MSTTSDWIDRRRRELGGLSSFFPSIIPSAAPPQRRVVPDPSRGLPYASRGSWWGGPEASRGSWWGGPEASRGSWWGGPEASRGSWWGSDASRGRSWWSPTEQRPTETALSFFSGIFSYLFYLSIISFFIFMILIVVHYTITPVFKFDSSGTSAPIDVSAGITDGQLSWSSGPAPPDSPPSPGFKNLLNSDYTLSFDVFVSTDFSTVSSPHVVLYRSTAPKELPATIRVDQISGIFTDSNIIVHIDSTRNDLNITMQTKTSSDVSTSESLPPIVNVPVGTPFRVGIIFTSNYVEAYINGKLEGTRILEGTLIGSQGTFYSPPSRVSSRVKIANIQYWARILTPSDLRAIGPVLPAPSFFKG
jgi:hypothetical protein